MQLLEKYHVEYKIEFDSNLARYFRSMLLRCGCELYDMECFEMNLPPMDRERYGTSMQTEVYIMNQASLNITLQDALKEAEKDLL